MLGEGQMREILTDKRKEPSHAPTRAGAGLEGREDQAGQPLRRCQQIGNIMEIMESSGIK